MGSNAVIVRHLVRLSTEGMSLINLLYSPVKQIAVSETLLGTYVCIWVLFVCIPGPRQCKQHLLFPVLPS